MSHFDIVPGLNPSHRTKAAELFWEAFSQKLSIGLGPERQALRFLNRVMDPSHAISAVDDKGNLLGVAGFKTSRGAFVGGELSDMMQIYGRISGFFRGLLLSFLERDLQADTLLMDGIFVTENARGKGVGTRLLQAIKEKAIDLECQTVRLDVISSNPRAKALYEREGFEAGEVTQLGPLKHVFGFQSSTTMICRLKQP